MRLHISLDDQLVAELDRRVGKRRRSAFLAETLRGALDDERRWDGVMASLGGLQGSQPSDAWGDDPAAWVREQRRADRGRIG